MLAVARVNGIKRIPYHKFVRRPKLAVSVHAFTLLRASATMAVSHSSWTRKVYGVVQQLRMELADGCATALEHRLRCAGQRMSE